MLVSPESVSQYDNSIILFRVQCCSVNGSNVVISSGSLCLAMQCRAQQPALFAFGGC